jgi:hypothetical protein
MAVTVNDMKDPGRVPKLHSPCVDPEGLALVRIHRHPPDPTLYLSVSPVCRSALRIFHIPPIPYAKKERSAYPMAHTFHILVVGCGGGPSETNLSSYVCIDSIRYYSSYTLSHSDIFSSLRTRAGRKGSLLWKRVRRTVS